MALFDIFKKKKKEEGKREEKKAVKDVPKKPVEKKAKEVARPKPAKQVKRRATTHAYRILKMPHVSEKATDLIGKNKYVFKVLPGANKTEVKRVIEDLFGVDVLGVRIVNIPRRKRRLGKIEGWRGGYKKAIVRVKEGQKIEVLPR